MAITDPLVLSRDVILVPVAELPAEARERFTHEEGDWAITHPRSRTPSSILDAASAALVEQFRAPRTIVEAVIRYCGERGGDPEPTLEEAYPLLQRLLASGFLVEESAAEAEGIRPSLHPGEDVAGFTVVECVQGLEDTELYLVRGPDRRSGSMGGALKIERPAVAGRSGGLFEREEAILRWLAGDGTPRLLASGPLEDGRRWLVTEWFSGVDVATAAWELQRDPEARSELLALARRIVEAYAALHTRGVVHADVHPRNVLVAADGSVRLLDFGYSRWDAAPADLAAPPRAGVAFFFEPEYAAATRAGQAPPDASPLGEQYAVAALLYSLLTGAHPRDYSLDRDAMLRQIAEEPPLPFAGRGVDPWPEVEPVLRRALAKDPAERFPSMADLATALAEVAAPPRPARPRANDLADAEALLERVLERVRPGGALFEKGTQTAPTASVNYGAAGVACAVHRMAVARADGELLALADLWAERAASLLGTTGSYYNPEIDIREEMIGPTALYHTATGIHAARALIAQTQSFEGLRDEAVASFLQAAADPGPNQDLTLGRSGLLLGGALLLDLLPEGERRRDLAAWGEELRRGLWEELEGEPPIRDEDPAVNLGLAHGWAGHLYAALRWSRSAGAGLPERFVERLADLAACARPWGRGLRWRWHGMEAATMPGWCNGSAGHLFLWTQAAEMLREPRWRDLAERTAWNTWESPDTVTSLCCGLAGRAYALLSLWRKGGGPEWLARARTLANRAARAAAQSDETPDSLYKGAMGVAVLAADLAKPEQAAMPLFEEEGW